ncbi:MAG: glutaredoxin family protein [Spirochaetota bacterium]
MFPEIPYETVDTHQDDGDERTIILYSLSFCHHCREARRLLEELHVSFRTTHLDLLDPEVRRPALRELREIHGDRVPYPVLEIDGSFTFGFDRDEWMRRLGSTAE